MHQLKTTCSICSGPMTANPSGTLAVCTKCDGLTCKKCGAHSDPVVGRKCRCRWEG